MASHYSCLTCHSKINLYISCPLSSLGSHQRQTLLAQVWSVRQKGSLAAKRRTYPCTIMSAGGHDVGGLSQAPSKTTSVTNLRFAGDLDSLRGFSSNKVTVRHKTLFTSDRRDRDGRAHSFSSSICQCWTVLVIVETTWTSSSTR